MTVRSHGAPGPQHRRADADGGTTKSVVIVFVALMLAILLYAMDQTIVATALPTIVGDLHGVSQLAWVTTVYLLTATATLPIYGKLGDLVGRKGLFIFSICLFLAGSILSGISQNMTELIAFRGLQGVGGGGLMIGAQAIIGDIVPPRERGKYMGFFGAVFGVATVAGPLLGGALTEYASWRWVFYVNVPIGAVALPIVIWALKLPRHENKPKLDILGMLLIAAASVAITLFATWGGSTYAWSSPVIIGLGVGFVLLAALFVLAERYAAEPIFPLRLFRSGIFNISGLIGVVVGVALFGAVAYLGYFLQMVDHVTATVSGLLMLPFVGGMLVSSITSGQIVTKTGRYKVFPILGMAIAGGGMYLLSLMSMTSTRVENGIYMAVLGFGIGLVMQILVLVVQNAAPIQDLGSATAANNYIRQIGGTIGTGIVGSLFASRLTSRLHQLLPPAAASHVHSGQTLTPQMVRGLPAPIAHAVTEAYAQALPPIFRYLVPLLGVGFVLAFFVKEKRLRTTVGMAPEGAATTAEAPGNGGPDGRAAVGTAPAAPQAAQPAAGVPTGPPTDPAAAVRIPVAAGAAVAPEARPARQVDGTRFNGAPVDPWRSGAPLAADGSAPAFPPDGRADLAAIDGSEPMLVLASAGHGEAAHGRAESWGDEPTRLAAGGEYAADAGAGQRPAGSPARPYAAYVGAPPAGGDVDGAGGPPVHGHVRQADGGPIAGATVTVIDLTGRQAGRDRTGSDGSYRIPVPGQGTYTVIAMAAARQPHAAAVYVGSQPVELDVLLAGASRLTGTVRAAGSGAPLAGATVTLANMAGEVMAVRGTDATGRYLFEDLVPGQYTLAVSAPSCQPVALPVAVADGAQTVQDAELPTGSRLVGTALTTRGTPVPEARITLLDADGNVTAMTTTGPDGRYTFDNVPQGEYTVIATGYPPSASRLRIASGQPHSHDVQLGYPEA